MVPLFRDLWRAHMPSQGNSRYCTLKRGYPLVVFWSLLPFDQRVSRTPPSGADQFSDFREYHCVDALNTGSLHRAAAIYLRFLIGLFMPSLSSETERRGFKTEK